MIYILSSKSAGVTSSSASGLLFLSLRICRAINQYTSAIAFLPLLLTGITISTLPRRFGITKCDYQDFYLFSFDYGMKSLLGSVAISTLGSINLAYSGLVSSWYESSRDCSGPRFSSYTGVCPYRVWTASMSSGSNLGNLLGYDSVIGFRTSSTYNPSAHPVDVSFHVFGFCCCLCVNLLLSICLMVLVILTTYHL